MTSADEEEDCSRLQCSKVYERLTRNRARAFVRLIIDTRFGWPWRLKWP